ncbi:MAG TPA: trehalose-6-phosphate synthase [Terriglobales bacterium]|nr:trehalose-6-phosphate synthase [Terriglobales bacterium]
MTRRLIVVSNRLPLVLTREGAEWRMRPATGGLVTALAPVLAAESGLWIGWPGTKEEPAVAEQLRSASEETSYGLEPVFLTAEERSRFYLGFSNEIIWPLFHDLQSRCNFDPAYWGSYLTVNRKFAAIMTAQASDDSLFWVHDYHLMEVARFLREQHTAARTAFFLHIPFPPPDIYAKLPWRDQILKSLLEFDLLGFQTQRDQRNFLQCVRGLVRDATLGHDGRYLAVRRNGHRARVGFFPISIDFRTFTEQASEPQVADRAARIRVEQKDCQIVLGVDRLDYTKGIPERLKAFRNLLARFPDLHRKIVLVQVAVPSRSDIPRYRELKTEIERLVSEINGQYTQSGWVPIHYLYRSLSRRELLAYYRAASIALITPLKDGMNLVAKEYCAAQVEHEGALILSEFAGAAAELKRGALLVNPYDSEGVADAIHRAFTMDLAERHRRMLTLRQIIRRADIFHWASSFLRAAD